MNGEFFRFALLLSLISLTIISACSRISPDNQNNSTPEFEVLSLEVSPRCAFTGENATVTAIVINRNNVDSKYMATFLLDGQSAIKKEVMLHGSKTANISFTVSSDIPATKEIAIDGFKTSVSFYTPKRHEIQYDNYDIQVNAGAFSAMSKAPGQEPYGQMVCFTAPFKPFIVNKIKMRTVGSFSQNENVTQMTINLWDSIGNNLWSENYPWPGIDTNNTWVEYVVPDIPVDNDVYVEMVSHSLSSIKGLTMNSPLVGEKGWRSLGGVRSKYPTRSSFSDTGLPLRHASSSNDGLYVSYCLRIIGKGGPITVISYDDGIAEMYYAPANHGYAVKYTAASYPFVLNSIQFYAYRDLDISDNRSIVLKIVDSDSRQILGTKTVPWTAVPYSDKNKGHWINIDIDNIICNNDFYIDLSPNNGSGGSIWLGCDSGSPSNRLDISVGGDLVSLSDWQSNTYRFVSNNTPPETIIFSVVNNILINFGQTIEEISETKQGNINSYSSGNTKWMIRVTGICK